MRWINNYTGEVFETLIKAIITIFSDMKNFEKCRTVKMFDIKRFYC